MFEQVEQFTANVRPVLRALKDDFDSLTIDVNRLCRDEIALGKKLVGEGMSRIRITAVALGAVLFFCLAALTLLVVSGVLLLRNIVPDLSWAAVFGISGLVCLLIAGAGILVAVIQWKHISELRKRSTRLF